MNSGAIPLPVVHPPDRYGNCSNESQSYSPHTDTDHNQQPHLLLEDTAFSLLKIVYFIYWINLKQLSYPLKTLNPLSLHLNVEMKEFSFTH